MNTRYGRSILCVQSDVAADFLLICQTEDTMSISLSNAGGLHCKPQSEYCETFRANALILYLLTSPSVRSHQPLSRSVTLSSIVLVIFAMRVCDGALWAAMVSFEMA